MKVLSILFSGGRRRDVWTRGSLLFFFIFQGMFLLTAQVPDGFTYQAVVRDADGQILINHALSVRMRILQGSTTGDVKYEEVFEVTTNAQGLFTVTIGQGEEMTGSFGDIDWSAGPYYLEVGLDLSGGSDYQVVGTTPFNSVPYALYAKEVADKDDADADPANEIQDLSLQGNILTITRNASATQIDLTPYLDNTDAQQLSLEGHKLSISNGNTVQLPDSVNDADHDPTNEIQDLHLENNILTITRNGSATQIDLSPYLDNAGWTRDADTLTWPKSVAIGGKSMGSKLAVQGDDLTTDKPLFEVKRKDGQTVFAVYNDSVRIYVNADPNSKGYRGGFAIGGFGVTKGRTQDLLRITPDSVRFYLQQPAGKGFRGGFAIGGYDVSKGMTMNYMMVTGDSTRIYTTGGESGFGVRSLSGGSYTSYMQLTPANYFIGHRAGEHIQADTSTEKGVYNAVFGYEAGRSLTTGKGNFFAGYQAGLATTIANYNVFIGTFAGYSNLSGHDNVYIGTGTGYSNQSGNYNVMLGTHAGYNYSGSYSVYIGINSGPQLLTGQGNTFLGTNSGMWLTHGSHNVFIGTDCGRAGYDGSIDNDDNAMDNVILGYQAAYNISQARSNVVLGSSAGRNLEDGYDNVLLGTYAGKSIANGSGNVLIGSNVDLGADVSGQLAIGNGASPPLIRGDFKEEKVQFNGSVTIRDMMSLTPVTLTYPDGEDVKLPSTASYIYLDVNPDGQINVGTIEPGRYPGQVLILTGHDENDQIRINPGDGVLLNGGLQFIITSSADVLMLIWNGAAWTEISRSNNQ